MAADSVRQHRVANVLLASSFAKTLTRAEIERVHEEVVEFYALYVPFARQVAGVQVFLSDGDGERTATELMWTARWSYGADGIEWRLGELGRLLFVDAPVP